MKNTTFRKKALLSSVAMLLVALVALGSATFAWFAANPNADATGISAKTTASSGLVIATDTEKDWSHNANLFVGKDTVNLQPANQDQDAAATLVGIAAADSKSWEASEDASLSPVGDTAFYAEKVYFRLSDNSADEPTAQVKLQKVQINAVSGAHLAGAIRVAVADQNGKVLATYATTEAGKKDGETTLDAVLAPYGTNDGTEYGGAGLLIQDTDTDVACLTKAGLTVEDDFEKAPFVTVYVYLDGQDTACYSDNVSNVDATEIITGIKTFFVLET